MDGYKRLRDDQMRRLVLCGVIKPCGMYIEVSKFGLVNKVRTSPVLQAPNQNAAWRSVPWEKKSTTPFVAQNPIKPRF